jgi:WD40 repeat protein
MNTLLRFSMRRMNPHRRIGILLPAAIFCCQALGCRAVANAEEFSNVESIAVSKDGTMIAVETDRLSQPDKKWRHEIALWTSGPWRRVSVLTPKVVSECLTFSHDGRLIASGDYKRVQVWNVKDGSLAASFRVRDSVSFLCVSFSSDDKQLIVGSPNQKTYLWTLGGSPEPTSTLDGGASSFVENGKRILIGDSKKGIPKILDSRTLAEIAVFDGQVGELERHIVRMAVSTDETICASVAVASSTPTIWSITKRKLLVRLQGHKQRVNTVSLSADGKLAATGSSDHSIKIWDTVSGKELATRNYPGSVEAVAFMPDAKSVVAGGGEAFLPENKYPPHPVWIWEWASDKVATLEPR